jgi:arylsulfatase A-like enzyme
MKLTRHYSGSPVCAPSRCVLMTGLHPGHAPIRDNKEAKGPEGQMPLPSGPVTLAQLLHDAGYASGLYGKWGLGQPNSSGDPLQRGFDHLFGYYCQRHAHSHYPAFLYADGKRVELNSPGAPGHGKLDASADRSDPATYAKFRAEHYAPDRIADAALAFVRENRNRPFFCYMPSTLPHLALQAPSDAVLSYAGKFAETPYDGKNSYTPVQAPRATYAAMISRLDHHVGLVLALLDELDLAKDTIVVFTSDNGATHSPVGGTDVDFFDSCGGLRGRKGSLYEGGIRVPAIVRWPGHVAPGSTSDRITGFEDWLPTLAELCDQKQPQGIDGISFAPTLRGNEQPARPFLYREFAGYGGWQAVWSGSLKLVRKNLLKGGDGDEFYDLSVDPKEAKNLRETKPTATSDGGLRPPSQASLSQLLRIAAEQHQPSADFALPALDEHKQSR